MVVLFEEISFVVGSSAKSTLVEMPSMFFLKDTVKTTFQLVNMYMCSYSNDALNEKIIIDGTNFVFVKNCL